MADKACRAESSRLLVNTASDEDSSSLQPQLQRAAISCPPPKHLCLPSKAAILILLWTAIVGAIYYIFMDLAVFAEIYTAKYGTSFSVYDSLI